VSTLSFHRYSLPGYAKRVMFSSLFDCLFDCEQLNAKTSERICSKFSGKVGNRPMNKWLKFGGDPDPDPYRDTGKTCFGGGMHCPLASSLLYAAKNRSRSENFHTHTRSRHSLCYLYENRWCKKIKVVQQHTYTNTRTHARTHIRKQRPTVGALKTWNDKTADF